jgi:hypothetical protein
MKQERVLRNNLKKPLKALKRGLYLSPTLLLHLKGRPPQVRPNKSLCSTSVSKVR